MMAKRAEPTFRKTIAPGEGGTAVDTLAAGSGISKTRIKDAMNKGAVWLSRGRKCFRLRRATAILAPGDHIELYYDPDLLACFPAAPVLVHDAGHYTIWNKPAGLLTQGTEFGDHGSLLRQVELYFSMKREVFPVHRLDREASGLILVAHSSAAAARLSDLFQKQAVEKTYRAIVRGIAGHPGDAGVIETPLDGKPACTHYRIEAVDAAAVTSTLLIQIESGRLHQIRRHCASIGYPVMGDPKYGTGNKNSEGLQLVAESLAYRCPYAGKRLEFSVAD